MPKRSTKSTPGIRSRNGKPHVTGRLSPAEVLAPSSKLMPLVEGPIKALNTRSAKAVAKAIEVAVRDVAERFGLKLVPRETRILGTSSLVYKVEVATPESNGTILDKRAAAYREKADAYGLCPEWLHQSFFHGERTYTIVGLNEHVPRLPIVATADGKEYGLPVALVQQHFSSHAGK